MVSKPLRPCAVPGCPELVTDECVRHPRTTGASSGAYDADWAVLAKAYLRVHPWCWCGARASEVDHIIPVRMGGAKYDLRNLRSLCHPHHSQITAATRSRVAPPRLYRRRLR